MIVQFHKKFVKDLSGLPAPYRKRIEVLVFETIPAINSVQSIPGAEKLKGYSGYYKIRIGNYRLGLLETDSGAFLKEYYIGRKSTDIFLFTNYQ